MRNKILIFLLSTLTLFNAKAQLVNDYGAITSGTWTTTAIWRQWDGTGWNTIPASYPNASTANVWILSGSIVTVNGTGPYNTGSIRVQSTGKLYANTTAQIYLSVWGGNIVCDGEIGNTLSYDGLSFNIEGANCTVSGTGTFTASRIRKSAITNPTTVLVVAMNVALRWSVSSATAIYNNVATGNSRFDVTVNAGCTLNVAGSPSAPANLSIDGIAGTGGSGVYDAAGTYTINGTLIVAGILYATTDNTTAGYSAAFNISGTGIIKANQINSPSSGLAATVFNVYSGGKLELTGPNGFWVAGGAAGWGTVNNRYSFLPGSTVEYSAAANQSVLARSNFNAVTSPNNDYWNLITSGSGTKTILTNLILGVRSNLTINSPTVLDQNTNAPDILIGGNWLNWGQAGFNQSLNLTKKVYFQGNATAPGVAQQTIACPGGEIFTNLWIAKAVNASVKLLSPISVTNILQLGAGNSASFGILELNGNSLTLENPGPAAITLIGTGTYNRFIIAEDPTSASLVRWNIGSTSTPIPNIAAIILGTQNFWPWPYVIPFGINSNTDTIPFGFYKPSAGDMGYLSVTTYGTAGDNLPWPSNASASVTNLNAFITANNLPDNRDWTVDRFWYLGATTPVTGCGVAFLYTYGNRSGVNEYPLLESSPFNMKDQYWDNTQLTWALPQEGIGVGPFPFIPVLIPSAVVDTSVNAWNTFYTLSSLSSPLPIEIINFYGKHYGENIKLFWTTASEINNDYFIVYKSYDGITYDELDHVDGSGNSNVYINYEYLDDQICDTIVYYKLRQVDYDGKYTESDPIAIQCTENNNDGEIKCYDILGREVGDDYDGIKIYYK